MLGRNSITSAPAARKTAMATKPKPSAVNDKLEISRPMHHKGNAGPDEHERQRDGEHHLRRALMAGTQLHLARIGASRRTS